MPQWAAFLGIAGVVLVLLLVLTHLTQTAFTDGDREQSDSGWSRADASVGGDRPDVSTDTGHADGTTDANRADIAVELPSRTDESGRESRGETNPTDSSADDTDGRTRGVDESPTPPPASSTAASVDETGAGSSPHSGWNRGPDPIASDEDRRPSGHRGDPTSMTTGMVLLNVALSQGLFALVLLGAAIYTAIPSSALGLELSVSYLETGLLAGAAAGVAFYVANELGAAAATWVGFDHDEGLRELLAPDSVGGWVLLLVCVLPIIAVFEEFLFRAALIGVPAAGFGVSPWLLAVVSSIAFAMGHGMQGSVGIVVTGLLGFALATVFIVTGSLLVVVVAHYLVNALEFVVHEALGIEWAEILES
ncbi:CPBP family intramembrane glutamic endopeptidase [Natrinema gelatinilyticum]|uniref:CPBP family intramembrane glutamic endopeptidase n=1 Tax=Natrinema gelatinilyticum TaxID=2961571 RepID=UPI0020C3E068|nr:CPBP family glutamic-type intramembrane protease [Natrinema gelatinilyticum]